MVTGRLNIAVAKIPGWTACWIDTSKLPVAADRGSRYSLRRLNRAFAVSSRVEERRA